ncbi:DUF3159 domain-containing protein [Pseudonocardia abyssalis]|uniref:DUF3159 domain-containing protein n=1 Tax=Pseudonocardia abyssalis TaxID=2792008 RepID=A0ABS6UTS8_9PSEU|nr:DUF3159 domain-containing protein [Pseudonocardia abyssalis]MBW0113854.1 DUF3159 domain-containing protein [Pseudonocardia abyssalis]MBW0135149.1 DUF3159 domain-containing protein [Pseudonocardia abyssalis]
MTATDPHHGPAGEKPRGPAAAPQTALLEQMGGPMGFVYSAVPVVVFVAANSFLPLTATIVVSIAVGLAVTGYRLLRGEKFGLAVGGLLGLALAIAIVAITGSARDFFVVGIWAYLAAFVITLGSVLARRPLTGVVWNLVHGNTHGWRADRRVLRAHDVATLALAAVSGARFGVQQWLYVSDETGWLGVARLAMGWPLTILAALVVVWAWRRSSRRLVPTA